MADLIDIGNGVKMADFSKSASPLESAQKQLGLIDLVNRIQAAPVEQRLKEIDAALKGNELLMTDIKNEKARVDLVTSKNDEARKQMEFTLNQLKSLPTLFNTDFKLGKAWAQQLGMTASKNEDGTVRLVKPGRNGTLESINLVPKKITDPEKILQSEKDLRNEWEDGGKDFAIRSQFYKNMLGLAKLNSPQGDLGIIFSYMKTLDPVSSVQQGEQATAKTAPNVPDQIRNAYNRLLSDKGAFFTPEVRRGYLDAGKAIYDDALESHFQRGKFFFDMDSKRNKETNLNAKNILVPVGGIGYDEIAKRFEDAPQDLARANQSVEPRQSTPKSTTPQNKAATEFDSLMNNFYNGLVNGGKK